MNGLNFGMVLALLLASTGAAASTEAVTGIVPRGFSCKSDPGGDIFTLALSLLPYETGANVRVIYRGQTYAFKELINAHTENRPTRLAGYTTFGSALGNKESSFSIVSLLATLPGVKVHGFGWMELHLPNAVVIGGGLDCTSL